MSDYVLKYGDKLTITPAWPMHHHIEVKFGLNWFHRVGWPYGEDWIVADKDYDMATVMRGNRVRKWEPKEEKVLA